MTTQFLTKINILLFLLGIVAIVGAGVFFFTNSSASDESVQLVTVNIADGLRKEQTADILAKALDWDTEQETKFVVEDTARDILHAEGVLPSGTYEISTASSTYEVASMFLDRANKRYQELGSGLSPDEWYEVLKVAAITEREADTPTEMESVARSIWQNRYDYLRSDATVQYVRDTMEMYPDKLCRGQENVTSGMVEYDEYVGNNSSEEKTVCIHWRLAYTGADEDFNWWQPITEADKEIAHGYNTYLYEGLPQHPIATPSRSAIEAALVTRSSTELVTSPVQDEEDLPQTNDIAGTYTTTVPTDSGLSKKITLQLSPLQPGIVGGARASLTTDYMVGEALTREIGGWEMTEEGNVEVTVEPESSADGSGQDVNTIIFSIDNNTLSAIKYDESLYGSEGLVLRKDI